MSSWFTSHKKYSSISACHQFSRLLYNLQDFRPIELDQALKAFPPTAEVANNEIMTIAQSGCQSQEEIVASRSLDVLGFSLPFDERVSLSKLSPSAVPAWADARVQEYERRIKEFEGHIATFRLLRNTQSSIHVLPSELLAEIFVHACTTRRELQIAWVCRHWRAAATSTPRFWVNAIEGNLGFCERTGEQDFLRVALAKSGSLPLTLATDSFPNAWIILSPHSIRMVSLTVHAREDDEVVTLTTALSSGSFLNLRTLRATCRPWHQLPLSLDSRYLPNLRELDIDHVLLTSTSTVSTLEILTISHGVRSPSHVHVLSRALQRCSGLTTLALHHTRPRRWVEDVDVYEVDLQAVTLPKLRSVILED
ncbi:hypothetical protein C8Q80DRAFT_292877 [Daedaleopsis nitida]|nr:hypothetical protein C8Q80DRAFT_292877 [Daedaleopsis nitida]